jgi:hypothetical protein
MNWKTAFKILFYSCLHLFVTLILIFAAAFQLRIIDYPDGGEATWTQLIIPGIATILISPILTGGGYILPKTITNNLYFFGTALIVNSMLWAYAIDKVIAYFAKPRIRRSGGRQDPSVMIPRL